jgi:hypothetical protein
LGIIRQWTVRPFYPACNLSTDGGSVNRSLTLGAIEEFLTGHFRRDGAFWSEVTHMIHLLEDRNLYREKGHDSLASLLAQIRLKTVAEEESRYLPGSAGRQAGESRHRTQI